MLYNPMQNFDEILTNRKNIKTNQKTYFIVKEYCNENEIMNLIDAITADDMNFSTEAFYKKLKFGRKHFKFAVEFLKTYISSPIISEEYTIVERIETPYFQFRNSNKNRVSGIICLNNSQFKLHSDMSWNNYKNISLIPGDLLLFDNDFWLSGHIYGLIIYWDSG